MTCSPVSLATRKDWHVWNIAAAAKTSGRSSLSQATLGPADCDVRALPVRSRMAAAPSSSSSWAICALARVSMP